MVMVMMVMVMMVMMVMVMVIVMMMGLCEQQASLATCLSLDWCMQVALPCCVLVQ